MNEVGDVYVADCDNHRIMCWSSGSQEGRVVVGGNGEGEASNQFEVVQEVYHLMLRIIFMLSIG